MITQNPKNNHNVITNLWLLNAWSLQIVWNHLERGSVLAENFGQLICFQNGHNCKSVSLVVQLHSIDISLLHQVHQELFCWFLTSFVLFRSKYQENEWVNIGIIKLTRSWELKYEKQYLFAIFLYGYFCGWKSSKW